MLRNEMKRHAVIVALKDGRGDLNLPFFSEFQGHLFTRYVKI